MRVQKIIFVAINAQLTNKELNVNWDKKRLAKLDELIFHARDYVIQFFENYLMILGTHFTKKEEEMEGVEDGFRQLIELLESSMEIYGPSLLSHFLFWDNSLHPRI